MSKSSLLIGIVMALALHALLFWPGSAPTWRAPSVPVQLPAPHPVEVTQAPPLEESAPEPSDQASAPAPFEIEEVASAPAEPVATTGETSADEAAEDPLPPVRIQWDGPEDLRRAARSLDMRILGVDAEGKIVGEVSRSGPLEMLSFDGSIGTFSNRVRRIDDRSFFGSEILAAHASTLAGFWVLVPAALDRQITNEVRRAVEEAGADMDGVRFVEARFEQVDGFPPRFEVLHVARRSR